MSANCAKPSSRSRKLKPKFPQRKGTEEIGLDQPLDSVVLSKLCDSLATLDSQRR